VWDAVNLDDSMIEIRATVVRIKGRGLVNKPRPKSEAGYRRLALPGWAVEMLRSRFRDQPPDEVAFRSVHVSDTPRRSQRRGAGRRRVTQRANEDRMDRRHHPPATTDVLADALLGAGVAQPTSSPLPGRDRV
jgi:hypothetical protein